MGHDVSTLPTLVGRDDDLARLESAALGLGGRVVVSGDAGIGKTRLLLELGARARQAGWRVLTGHCVGEAGASLPYLPFAEVLTQLAEDEDLMACALAAGPEIAGLLPGPAPAGAGERVDRARLYAAVQAGLEAVGGQVPVLVLLEDVHWADESSRDLITLLITRGFRGPVGLVVTYRSDDLHRRHPLSPTVAVWSRTAGVERVHLAPLPDPAMADLVLDLGRPDLTDDQVADVVHRAEGNAFFAEELAAAASQGQGVGATELPRLLLLRVDALPEADRAVVRLAAVAGRQVRHRLLARVSGVDELELDASLRRAVERHVLTTAGGDGYVFRHALLAESLYDDLLPGERVRAHRAYVTALQADPSLGTAADLARHAGAAGDLLVSGRASVEAGEAALRVGGPAEALRHLEVALGVLTDDEELDAVVLLAARAATGVGRLDRARSLLRSRLTRPGRLSPDTRARLLGELAFVARMTEDDAGSAGLIEEGLSIRGIDERTRAGLLGLRAEVLLEEGEDAEAARVADDAMGLAVALELRDLQSDLNGVIARLSERGGDPQASLRRLESVVSTWGETTDLALLRALHRLGGLHYRQGRLRESLATFRAAGERARTVGLQWAPYGLDARTMAATVAYELGEWDLALEMTDHRSEGAPPPQAAALDATRMYVRAGRGEAPPTADFARIRAHWAVDGLIAIQSGSAMIELLGHAGELAEASRMHQELVSFIRRQWRQPQVMAEVRFAALLTGQRAGRADALPASELSGLTAETDALADEALAVWERCGCPPGLEGRAWDARLRAERLRLCWRGGMVDVDPGALLTLWHEATRLFRERGDAYEWARSRARLAAVEVASGQVESARAGLGEAAGVAIGLGAGPLLREVDSIRALLPGRGVRADQPGPGHAHLTPREVEVLRLLDAGRSNGQIGATLFISTKTASVHVSNILAKLGATSRGEAVAIARARGVIES